MTPEVRAKKDGINDLLKGILCGIKELEGGAA